MILVDTNVWSQAFRRQNDDHTEWIRSRLRLLRMRDELVIPGIALQELLSCLQNKGQVTRLRKAISPVRVLVADIADHHGAADIANTCRWKGIAASPSDCLIAAQAIRAGAGVFTFDDDFPMMAVHIPDLKLVELL